MDMYEACKCVHESERLESDTVDTISLLTSVIGSSCSGVSAVVWVRGGRQEVLVLQEEWTKPESGGLAVKQLGRGDDNMTMLKATSRPPSGNPGFMTQVSTCRFLLANLHSPPSPHPLFPFREKQRTGGCTPQSS